MGTEDSSLDYMEDPYFYTTTSTPSLDTELEEERDGHKEHTKPNLSEGVDFDDYLDSNDEELFDLRHLEEELKNYHHKLNQDELSGVYDPTTHPDESVNVEAEFFNQKIRAADSIVNRFFHWRRKAFERQVRVTYSDLAKPYLARLSHENNFRKFLEFNPKLNSDEFAEEAIAASTNHLPPADLSSLSVEEKERQLQLWNEELAQIEDEIATLRTVLGSKMRRSAELKRNLGITVWKEVSEDINQSIKNVKESNVYQSVENKVGQVTKAVTDAPIYQKTTSLIGGITGNITNKIGQMRHSESFRSIEEKVGTAYENVKTKVVSRSSSQQSLDEASRSRSGSVVTSPTIPEEKPLA